MTLNKNKMPNYCSNYITINGDAKSISIIRSACERCRDTEEGIFRTLIDIPSHMTNEQYEKEWYDTNVAWFGTKWDVQYHSCGFDYSENEIKMSPDTAWSPPIEFLTNLVKQYKGIEAYIFYSEGGIGFSGETKIYRNDEGQVIVDDAEYEYYEGIYNIDKDMFWGEVESHCDNFFIENDEMDEDDNPIPIPDEKITEYVEEYFPFVTEEDKEYIIKQFKDYINEQRESE